MGEAKEFRTLVVGTASSGITLANSMSIADIHELSEWVLGHPVWTHELGQDHIWKRMRELLVAQFPDLPTDDVTDHAAAAKALLATYGEIISVRRGSDERAESPLASLARVAPGKPTIVLTKENRHDR